MQRNTSPFSRPRIAKEMQIKRLIINSDSQLVVSQVNNSFSAKERSMAAYLKLVVGFIPAFENFKLAQISHSENVHTDLLLKLASCKDSELLTIVLIEHLFRHSVAKGEEMMWVEDTPQWLRPIIAFLLDQSLPFDKKKAQKA